MNELCICPCVLLDEADQNGNKLIHYCNCDQHSKHTLSPCTTFHPSFPMANQLVRTEAATLSDASRQHPSGHAVWVIWQSWPDHATLSDGNGTKCFTLGPHWSDCSSICSLAINIHTRCSTHRNCFSISSTWQVVCSRFAILQKTSRPPFQLRQTGNTLVAKELFNQNTILDIRYQMRLLLFVGGFVNIIGILFQRVPPYSRCVGKLCILS